MYASSRRSSMAWRIRAWICRRSEYGRGRFVADERNGHAPRVVPRATQLADELCAAVIGSLLSGADADVDDGALVAAVVGLGVVGGAGRVEGGHGLVEHALGLL